MDLGDIPAWIALAFSLTTFCLQRSDQKKNNAAQAEQSARAERYRVELEEKSQHQLIKSSRKLRLEDMIQDLDEILALSVQYWTSCGADSENQALRIKLKTRDFASRCSEYRVFLWDAAGQEFSTFRRHITGGLFEVRSRKAYPSNDPFISNASQLASDFRTNLRRTCDTLDSIV